ncbi:MAG: glycoside hydrolase family protein [Opitutaceae bacterium]
MELQKLRKLIATFLILPALCWAKDVNLAYEYIGKAVQVEGMHIWGSSPVIGPDGKVHLYVAQWPTNTQPNFNGWYKDCEIGHYVGDRPEGPFEFVRVAVPDQDGSFNAPHNPTITQIDGKYVLCFIVNENNKLKTQRIIMYVADDLNDEWRPAAGAEADGTIARKSTDPKDWNYTARLGVSNPSLIKHKGKYMLYVKSVVNKNIQAKGGSYTYGVMISDKLEGPYRHRSMAVTPVWYGIEDAYAFTMQDNVYLLSRDFGSKKGSHGGGLLWESKNDGLFFNKGNVRRSFEHLTHYIGKEAFNEATVYRGDLTGRLERPQILSIDGEPAYVYLATGTNDTPGHGSCSHVFRLKVR